MPHCRTNLSNDRKPFHSQHFSALGQSPKFHLKHNYIVQVFKLCHVYIWTPYKVFNTRCSIPNKYGMLPLLSTCMKYFPRTGFFAEMYYFLRVTIVSDFFSLQHFEVHWISIDLTQQVPILWISNGIFPFNISSHVQYGFIWTCCLYTNFNCIKLPLQ